jgi:hypothetical protein
MQKTYNGATITFQRGTVRSRLKGIHLYSKLGVTTDTDDGLVLEYSYFVRLLTQCKVEGDLGFKLPTSSDNEAALQAGYEAFMESDEALFDVVVEGLNAVDDSDQPEGLQPDAAKKS